MGKTYTEHSATTNDEMGVMGFNPLPVIEEAIPDELKQQPNWAVWIAEPKEGAPGKFNKAPRNADGYHLSPRRPEKWLTFEEAITAYRTGLYSGIGVLLDGSIVGIDIDNAPQAFKDHSELKALISEAIKAGVYCEQSPSGKGLRLFLRGDITRHLDSQKGGMKHSNLEIYQSKRFLTVTGQRMGASKHDS